MNGVQLMQGYIQKTGQGPGLKEVFLSFILSYTALSTVLTMLRQFITVCATRR